MSTAKEPGKIQRLDPAVVNRIAAGEVVQYPSSALKELLENSLDAGATQISITTADAGLKSLQIHDNGCGMRREDLTLACERHATSKLNAYEDLRDMRTFGFRGEALASISLCSRLTITTRVASSTCAYRAYYIDGIMQPTKPGDTPGSKPCAGKVGTQILVSVFYRMLLPSMAI
jgi:DNA mismatch repair protein MLH1